MVATVGTPLILNATTPGTFSLTNGSGAGRAVVAIATQHNSFTSLDQVTLNGVLATLVAPLQFDGLDNRALVGVWGDADLPASPGDYEVTIDHSPGVAVALIELSNADVTTVDTIVGAGAGTFPDPFNLNGNSGAFLGLAWTQVIGGDPISTTGDTEHYGDNRKLIVSRVDSGAAGDISITGTSGSSFTYVAFAINTLSLNPSVTIVDPIIPGTTTAFSTGDFVDPLTGARITDSAGNVKELTLATQTSVSAPAMGDLDYVLFGDVTFEVYNATESATTTVSFDRPAGFNLLTLSASPDTTETGWLFNYGGTPVAGDQGIYNPVASDTGETLTLNGNGTWSSTGSGTWPDIHVVDATDGFMEQLTLTAVGIIDSPASVYNSYEFSITLDLEVTVTSVTINGIGQTINSQSSAAGQTVVNLTAVQGITPVGTGYPLVANFSGGTADADVDMENQPPSGSTVAQGSIKTLRGKTL